MKTKIILFIFSLKIIIVYTSIELQHVKLIVDVVNSYNRPAHVLANVCWSPGVNICMFTYLFLATKLNLTTELRRSKRAKFINFMISDNIKGIRLTKNPELFFIVDFTCSDSEDFLNKADAANLFGKPFRWLILGNSDNNRNNIPEVMANLTILTNSEVIVSHLRDDVLCLYMIYKIKENDENWHMELYGTWKISPGLMKSAHMDISTTMRRRNLERNVVTTAMIAIDNNTIDNLYDLRNVEVDTVSKANIRHVDVLYDFMNASKVIKFTNTWGYFINGSWNGIVGHFVQREADIAASVMFITQDRLNVTQFVCHPTNIVVVFVFREPPLSYHSNLFLLPFKKTVWACMATFVVILMIIIYANAYWESIKLQNTEEISNCSTLRPKLSDIAILLISAMCQQGSSLELKGGVGRIMMFLIFLTFLFLYTSYSASIVALLQSSSNHIRTLTDLYNSKMELGIENLPYNIYYFSVAKEPIRKAIFENRIAPKGRKPNYLSLEEGVKRLQTQPFAFNMNIGSGYRLVNKYFHEHEKCGLQQISFIQNNDPYLSCAKNSPYEEIFKIGLQRGKEHGLLDRVNKMIYAKKPLCSVRGRSFISVNMMDFCPVLFMLLYGMLLSIVFLIIEIIVHRQTVTNK